MKTLENKLMQSPDLFNERLEKLRKLFPDLFTLEGKLNPDELSKIIDPELIKETERFEFNWFGKSEAKRIAFTPSKATLAYDKKRSVSPDNANGNIIIEGENLETMKVLLSSYRNQIDCIYIDPPYNIGKEYLYSDKWDETKEDYWEHIGVMQDGIKLDTNLETSGRYHSNWLNMIYSRLLVARLLLKENGLIFISIDENEIHHLMKVCNEVFYEVNSIGILTWIKRTKPINSGDAKYQLQQKVEYVCVFCKEKNKPNTYAFNLPIVSERKYNYDGKYGKCRLKDIEDSDIGTKKRDTMKFPILGVKPGKGKRWKIGDDEIKRLLKLDRVRKIKGKIKIEIYPGEEDKMKYKPFWSHFDSDSVGTAEDGKDELYTLLGKKIGFDTVKPVDLITNILEYLPNNILVLDFFAGSGTTGQAIIELNLHKGGDRKFILVQIPELTDKESDAYKEGYKKISDITIDRNKRVIEKIEKEKSKKEQSLLEEEDKPFKTGFKVYKLAKSKFPRVDFSPNPEKSEKENIKLLNRYIEEKESSFFSKFDEKIIFDEVLLKNGLMLNYTLDKLLDFSKNKIFKAKDNFKECLICLDSTIKKETLNELENYKDNLFICLERSLDTTMKWNLKHLLGEKLIAF